MEMLTRWGKFFPMAVLGIGLACILWNQLQLTQSWDPLLPFGVTRDPEHPTRLALRDFSTHLNYTKHFWAKTTSRPYTMEAQEIIMRAWVPEAQSGMPFPYAPPALWAALPFLAWGSWWGFFFFSFMNVVMAWRLACDYVMARIHFSLSGKKSSHAFLSDETRRPLLLATVGFFSLSFFSTLLIGQTSIVTTGILAWTWALLFDFRQQEWRAFGNRKSCLLLAFLLLVATAKPSLAIVVAGLLVAGQAWAAFLAGSALFLISSLALSPYLGGFPQWIGDYLSLLQGYHHEAMTPFMQPGLPPSILTSFFGFLDQMTPLSSAISSRICQSLWLGGTACLIGSVWLKRLLPSDFFRAHLLTFLIFCPHVSATEDWLVTLAVIEPSQERSRSFLLKLFLVGIVVNFRQGIPLAEFPFAWALGGKIGLLLLLFWERHQRNSSLHHGKVLRSSFK